MNDIVTWEHKINYSSLYSTPSIFFLYKMNAFYVNIIIKMYKIQKVWGTRLLMYYMNI